MMVCLAKVGAPLLLEVQCLLWAMRKDVLSVALSRSKRRTRQPCTVGPIDRFEGRGITVISNPTDAQVEIDGKNVGEKLILLEELAG